MSTLPPSSRLRLREAGSPLPPFRAGCYQPQSPVLHIASPSEPIHTGVSEKPSSRKPGEQARFPTPRYREVCGWMNRGFREHILSAIVGNSVNKPHIAPVRRAYLYRDSWRLSGGHRALLVATLV